MKSGSFGGPTAQHRTCIGQLLADPKMDWLQSGQFIYVKCWIDEGSGEIVVAEVVSQEDFSYSGRKP